MPSTHAAISLAAGTVNIEGPLQLGELALALLLASIVGLEREIRQKSAGLKTDALVGLGSALFMLISKYGFNDVVTRSRDALAVALADLPHVDAVIADDVNAAAEMTTVS